MSIFKYLRERSVTRAMVAAIVLLQCAPLWAGSTNLTLTSPNNYPMDQCTGFCDGMANRAGWKLSFTSKSNAIGWADGRIKNGTVSSVPTVGAIMVLGGPSSAGHVSWITSVTKTSSGYTLVVLEGNFQNGTAYGTVNGTYPYWQHTWYITTSGKLTAKISNGTTSIPVMGFVKQK